MTGTLLALGPCIWGPISVEAPSADGKLIALRAIERAYPQLLKRGRMSVQHKDQLVGEIVAPVLQVDPARIPASPELRAAIEECIARYGGLPTAPDVEITPAIAAAFPRLKPLVGEKVPFIAGTLYEDNRTAQKVREDIMERKLDSFSVSGMTFGTRMAQWCDPRGCRWVEEIDDMDLSAVTIGASTPTPGLFSKFKTMNHGAQFLVVQQAHAEPPSGRMSYAEQAAPDAALQYGGCGAQAIVQLLRTADAARLAEALRAPGRSAVMDALQQAEQGWLGDDAKTWAAELATAAQADEALMRVLEAAAEPLVAPGNRHGQAAPHRDEETASTMQPATDPGGTAATAGTTPAKPIEQAATPAAPAAPAPAQPIQQTGTATATPPAPGQAEALVEMSRRLEALEQGMADLKGRQPSPAPSGAPAPANQATPVTQANPTPPAPPATPKPVQQAETPDPAEPTPPGQPSDEMKALEQALDNGDPTAPMQLIEMIRARKG